MHTKSDVEVIFDEKRAEKVFPLLTDALESNVILRAKNLPQNRFFPDNVEEGSFLHQWVLVLAAVAMRARVNSDDAFFVIAHLLREHLEDFAYFLDAKTFDMGLLFYANIGVPFKQEARHLAFKADEIIKAWWSSIQILQPHGFEPLRIFEDTESCFQVCKRLKKIFGWSDKVSRLLVIWFEEAEFIEPLLGAPPLDFHVLRILLLSKILTIKGLAVGEPIRADWAIRRALPLLEEFCEEHKVQTLPLDSVIWLLSRNVCTSMRQQPSKCQWLCPIRDFCKGFYIRYRNGEYRDGIIKLWPKNPPVEFFGKEI